MNNRHNTHRILGDLIAIGGWRSAFDEHGHSTVHIDVVFREGRFGGEPDDKIRFTVTLKRAEVVVIVPQDEPVRPLMRSVARSLDQRKTLETHTEKQEAGGAAKAEVGFSPQGFLGRLALKVSARRSRARERTEQSERTGLSVQHFPISGDQQGWQQGWEISDGGRVLDGAPWDATKDPRLAVRRTREIGPTDDPPVIKVELRCRREDVEIDNLRPTSDGEPNPPYRRAHDAGDVNLAAAEQFIKTMLMERSLRITGDISDPDCKMIVADVLIIEDAS